MTIPTRDGLTRAIRYQRRHYQSHPHPKVDNIHDRNMVCVMRAAQTFQARTPSDMHRFLTQPQFNCKVATR